jgi:hypothetical protein
MIVEEQIVEDLIVVLAQKLIVRRVDAMDLIVVMIDLATIVSEMIEDHVVEIDLEMIALEMIVLEMIVLEMIDLVMIDLVMIVLEMIDLEMVIVLLAMVVALGVLPVQHLPMVVFKLCEAKSEEKLQHRERAMPFFSLFQAVLSSGGESGPREPSGILMSLSGDLSVATASTR